MNLVDPRAASWRDLKIANFRPTTDYLASHLKKLVLAERSAQGKGGRFSEGVPTLESGHMKLIAIKRAFLCDRRKALRRTRTDLGSRMFVIC